MFKQVGLSVERPPTPEEVDVSQPLDGMRRPGDNNSLLVCQVGHPESAQPLHSYKAALEPDGSLDTAKIDFVNGGDVFVGYDNRTKAFARLISPSLPPIIPSSVLDSHAVEQRTTMHAQAGTAAPRAESSERNRISSRSTIQPPHEVLRPEEDDIAPRRVYQLPRRLRSGPERNHSESSDIVVLVREQRDFDDTRAIIKNWEVNLEYNFSLDTSKIFSQNPSNPYYVRGSNGEYYPLNINDDPIVDPSYLEYYLQEMSGIAMPVLQIMRYSDYSRIRPKTR
ncbi:hypothetical protein H0H93_001578 [Arthromyces matolae]|nr:hypothetical protein H0H93_001578 [Arthromyces matolae]